MRRTFRAALCFLLFLPAIAHTAPEAFPRPPELEPAVRFWTQIYSQVTTDGGLLHDRDDLTVVYEQLHFDGMNHAQRRAHVRERREHYQAALRRLASSPQGPLSTAERNIMQAFGEDVGRQRLLRAADNVRFQLGQADRFRRGLIRSGAWEPHIRRTLREMGLPQEIAALPHVESSFNPNAYSRVGAAGIWQFTRPTGRRFMRVDHVIDERMDPFTATVAAARLLEHNYSVTGDWALALSAYNHGLAGIRRAAQAVGSNDIAEIIREYDGPRWGFASRNFYPAFLAAVDVDFESHKYFGILERVDPLVTETIELPFYTSVAAIQDAFEVDRDTLRELNRALRPPVWDGHKNVPRGYRLRVPASPERPPAAEMLARIERGDQHFAQLPDEFHRVQRGESLSIIAARYGTSVGELVSLNNLRNAHHIRSGQNLRLPVTGRPAVARGDVYTVQRGDTLSAIASRVGMSTSALATANGLSDYHTIQPGQELRVDGRAAETVTVAAQAQSTQAQSTQAQSTQAQSTQAQSTVDAEATAAAGETADEPATDAETASAETASAETAAEETVAEETATADMAAAQAPAADAPGDETPTAIALPPVDKSVAALNIETTGEIIARFSGTRASAQPPASGQLDADPADYTVADNATVEVQAAETLGHYADWLDLRASDLRRINTMAYGTPVVIGERIRLDFSHVSPAEFEQRRYAYHEDIQARFFRYYHITDTRSLEIRNGDSLWTLAQRSDNVPLWLLRQYNPELDFSRLRPGMEIRLPVVERHPDEEPAEEPADDSLVAESGEEI